MGVSKNRGTPKWMVKIMENPIKMDDLGIPLFSETSIYRCANSRRLYILLKIILESDPVLGCEIGKQVQLLQEYSTSCFEV